MTATALVWLRQDLRLADQPAFAAAAAAGAVIPVYVLDDETPAPRHRLGGAQRWWLHGSLAALAADLEALGSRLILRRGRADAVLARLADETGAARIHALRHAEPWWREAEAALGDRLTLHDGGNLAPLRHVVTGGGSCACSDTLADWALRPTRPDWATGFDMTPGAAEAERRLAAFADRVDAYEAERNLPASEGTSRLSPHLHFGEISPAAVWHGVDGHPAAEKFRKELAWRDFAQGVTLALPDYDAVNGNRKYDRLAWRTGAAAEADLAAWQRGRTGYPIVDAGMRQLWATGWMHNRVRMITASFLVKHLLIDWRRGWDWYWDTLVDADHANNSVNWQWVAGTGVDANMFSRIMAPLVQSEKFDAGDYIRRWVPELAKVPDARIHDPGPGGGYPPQLIGHREGRERALAAAQRLRAGG